MILLYITILLCMLIYSRSISDLLSRYASYLLASYYIVSLILCTLQFDGFYEVRIETQLLFLVGSIFFWLGFIRCKIIKKETYIDEQLLLNSSKRNISNIFIFLFIIGFCAFCIPYVPKALMIAELQGGAEMNDKDEIIFGGDNLITILYNVGMAIASNVALALIAASVVTGLWKRYFHLFAACVILQICYIILTGGRGNVFNLLVILAFVILCFNANRKKIHFSKKQLVFMAILLFVVFNVMSMVTNFRSHGSLQAEGSEKKEANTKVAHTFLNYTEAPINLLDVSFKENYKDKLGGYQYGKATFIGVDFLIQSFVKRLGFDYETDLYIVNYLQDNHKRCGVDKYYNYAYSMFFYNYMDFGVLGVIVIPFLFGFCIRYSIKRFYRLSSFPRMLMVLIMLRMMVTSHFTSPFIRPWDMLYILLIIFWDILSTKSIKSNRLGTVQC